MKSKATEKLEQQINSIEKAIGKSTTSQEDKQRLKNLVP